MNFPERLRELRKEQKLTQGELANELEVSKTAVSTWETGVRNPEFETLNNLSAYFNVSLDYLMGTSDIRKPDRLSDEEADELGQIAVEDEYRELIAAIIQLDHYGLSNIKSLCRMEKKRCLEMGTLDVERPFTFRIEPCG